MCACMQLYAHSYLYVVAYIVTCVCCVNIVTSKVTSIVSNTTYENSYRLRVYARDRSYLAVTSIVSDACTCIVTSTSTCVVTDKVTRIV